MIKSWNKPILSLGDLGEAIAGDGPVVNVKPLIYILAGLLASALLLWWAAAK